MKAFFSNANEKTSKLYAAISGIFSLLGIGGLLIGYFTGMSPIGHAVAGGEPILKGALMGVVIEIMRGSIEMPSYNLSLGLSGFLPMMLYILVMILISAVLLSLILTIAAFLLPRFSRLLALQQGRVLFFSYALLFAGNALLYLLSGGTLSASPFDLPCFLTAILLLFVLFLTALAENKIKSALNGFLFCMSLLTACAFLLPSTPLLSSVNALTSPLEDNSLRGILIAFCIVVALNFILSTVRLHAKSAYGVDIVRFGVQLLVMIALIAVCFFRTNYSFFSDQPLAAIFLLLGTLGGIALSLFCILAFPKLSRAPAKTAESV